MLRSELYSAKSIHAKPQLDFAGVSEDEFVHIFKHVQRERRKRLEDNEWKRFLGKRSKEKEVQDDHTNLLCNERGLKNPVLEKEGSSYRDEVDQVKTENNDINFGADQVQIDNTRPNYRSKESPKTNENSMALLQLLGAKELQRIDELKSKVIGTLNKILVLIKSDIEVDSDNELTRLRQRAMEFTARFTRIHFYQFKRQIDDLKKQLSNTKETNKKYQLLAKCLSLYQIGLQAMQTFEKHLPSCIIDGIPTPIIDFLKYLRELCTLVNRYYKEENKESDELEELCESTVITFNEHKFRAGSFVIKNNNKNNKKPKKTLKKNNTFSMYSPSCQSWKKKSTALAKARFGSPTKESSKNEGEINARESSKNEGEFSGGRTVEDKGKDHKRQRNGNNLVEDDIITVVETIPTDLMSDEVKPDTISKENEHFNTLEVSRIESMKLEDIWKTLNSALDELRTLLQHIKTITKFDPEREQQNFIRYRNKRQMKSDNVKLLCIKEEEDEKNMEKTNSVTPDSKMRQKFKRLENTVANNYRELFHIYKNTCPYYQSPNKHEPWNVIGRVADEISNYIILNVSQELEMDDLIKAVFDMEFEE